MNRGEIWYFDFKKPDKPRPVLILTRQEVIPYLDTVTIAPITRTIRGIASEVVVGVAEGLKEKSVINLHHVMTIPKNSLRKFVGTVSDSTMSDVETAMLFALGFDD